MNHRSPCALLVMAAVGFLVASAPRSAEAQLILGFTAPAYTINDIGQSATVGVTLTQGPLGPQVGVGNSLVSFAILVSFTPGSGIASLTSVSDPVGWDAFSSGVLTSPVDITGLSFFGPDDLSSPLTIANLTFQGVAPGNVTLSVQQFDVSSDDFVTELGDVIDPTNTATATLTVLSTIPEPSPMALSFLVLGAATAFRRFHARRDAA